MDKYEEGLYSFQDYLVFDKRDPELLKQHVAEWGEALGFSGKIDIAENIFDHDKIFRALINNLYEQNRLSICTHYFTSILWQLNCDIVPDLIGNITIPIRSLSDSLFDSMINFVNPSKRPNSMRIIRTMRKDKRLHASIHRLSFIGICVYTHWLLNIILQKIKPEKIDSMMLTDNISFYRFSKSLLKLSECLQYGLGWIVPTSDRILIIEKPTRVLIDSRFRLHADNGSALEWFNGISKEYYWHGARVNPGMINNPNYPTIDRILQIRNIESRRLFIEKVGIENLMKNSNPEKIHADLDYGSRRELLRLVLEDDEPIVAVRITCPSTGRIYFLRVPPEMNSCDEAIAWSFGFVNSNEYHPSIQT